MDSCCVSKIADFMMRFMQLDAKHGVSRGIVYLREIPAADAKSAREGLEHIYEGGTTEVSAESPTRKGHAQIVLNWRCGMKKAQRLFVGCLCAL